MKQKIPKLILPAISVMAFSLTLNLRAANELPLQCKQTVADFQQTDPAIKSFIENAAGYAVFPDVGKGGFIVGGARGKGLLYEKGAITGQTTMTQASIGAQAGGQSFAEVICFESPGAVSDFKAGKFEMGADVSAVVVSQGASQSAKYKQGVAVFAMPKKGLMVQASVGGQKFKFEPLISPTGP
jgi:lipid-binding SYLF domain-containing protein